VFTEWVLRKGGEQLPVRCEKGDVGKKGGGSLSGKRFLRQGGWAAKKKNYKDGGEKNGEPCAIRGIRGGGENQP